MHYVMRCLDKNFVQGLFLLFKKQVEFVTICLVDLSFFKNKKGFWKIIKNIHNIQIKKYIGGRLGGDAAFM